jgi:hypothetical protein
MDKSKEFTLFISTISEFSLVFIKFFFTENISFHCLVMRSLKKNIRTLNFLLPVLMIKIYQRKRLENGEDLGPTLSMLIYLNIQDIKSFSQKKKKKTKGLQIQKMLRKVGKRKLKK